MTAPWQEVVIGYMEWLRQTKGTEELDRVKEDFREWALGPSHPIDYTPEHVDRLTQGVAE